MHRRKFIQNASLPSGSILFNKQFVFADDVSFENRRPPLSKRNFTSMAVEDAIAEFKAGGERPRTGLAV